METMKSIEEGRYQNDRQTNTLLFYISFIGSLCELIHTNHPYKVLRNNNKTNGQQQNTTKQKKVNSKSSGKWEIDQSCAVTFASWVECDER